MIRELFRVLPCDPMDTAWNRRLWWLERTSGWLSLGIVAATIAMAVRDLQS
jgi:hypothetical protein